MTILAEVKKKTTEMHLILTKASFARVEVRKNVFVTSIAWSGMSRRSLSPISAKADKRATWSPCNIEIQNYNMCLCVCVRVHACEREKEVLELALTGPAIAIRLLALTKSRTMLAIHNSRALFVKSTERVIEDEKYINLCRCKKHFG